MTYLVEGDVYLYDGNGNAITSVLDGSDRRLHVESKALLYDSAGNAIASYDDSGTRRLETRTTIATGHGLATETTLASIKDTDGVKKITDALPAGSNLMGKVQLRNPGNTADLGDATNPVRNDPTGTTTQPISAASLPLPTGAATESTLAAADTKLGTIDGVLDSIKDTDGVKKITDALPVGDNSIGRVKITDGTEVADVVTDNSINRLETRNSIVGQTAGTGAEKKVSVIDDIEDTDVKRLQTQALLAPGSTVNIGTSIPADPANLTIEFLTNATYNEDMLQDGSTTAVEFSYSPGAGTIVAVESLLFVFTADDFEFDGASFGPNAALSTGIQTKLTVSPSSETTLFTIKQNEDFLRIPGRVPVINNTGPKDLLSAAFVFGGLVKLDGDEGDKVSVYINDNLTSVKFKYLTATLYGAEV